MTSAVAEPPARGPDAPVGASGLVTIANKVSRGEKAPSRNPRVRKRWNGRRHRYELRSVLWDVSSLTRVCGCGRWRRKDADAVAVRSREDGSTYYDGVQSCGSIWACPVCSAKIRQRRAAELERGILSHLDAGGGVAVQVLTLPHDAGDRLEGTFDTVAKGWKRVQSGRAWQRLKDELGLCGTFRATEVTHGPNGWHPHVHVLFFFERLPSASTLARLESHVYAVWSRYVEGQGFRRPMQSWCGVEPVRRREQIADYLTKAVAGDGWSVAIEVTRHDLKAGRDDDTRRGHRTPWQILQDFSQTGDEADLGLWLEYERVTKGRRAMSWSRGLKARLGVAEKSDDELAAEEQGGVVVTWIASVEWAALCRVPGALCRVLETAETGDPAEVLARVHAEIQRPRGSP